MPEPLTYPGVYVEEAVSLSLSVRSGATAVPVIVAGQSASPKSENAKDPFAEAQRVESWTEFERLNGVFDEAASKNLLAVSVRTYFENGGGPCFIVRKANLAAQVPGLIDATLIVAAGEDIKGNLAQLVGKGKLRFAILDAAKTEPNTKTNNKLDDNLLTSPYAAAYYPYLSAPWTTMLIPPSAAVAGVYCTVDRERGVWKAPANVPLQGGLKPCSVVTDAEQGSFTSGPIAVNMIRDFPGTGTLVWGARTLAADDDNWRYIPVRRLFDAVERDVRLAANRVMYEPNAAPTWERVRGAIDNYLHELWRSGGLMGETPKEAYFVHVGLDKTMTRDDITQGKMIVRIGLSPVRPAEFIVLEFTQDVMPG
ncbi:MAG: phage tail sheath family protein [Actinobacteria bacterium]|nr:phage tail sheath family protein [Actinomycetota bacterium]